MYFEMFFAIEEPRSSTPTPTATPPQMCGRSWGGVSPQAWRKGKASTVQRPFLGLRSSQDRRERQGFGSSLRHSGQENRTQKHEPRHDATRDSNPQILGLEGSPGLESIR